MPLLFNIFLSDILKLYGVNGSPQLRAIGFADDLVLYRSSKNVELAKIELQAAFHKMCDFFGARKLSCNFKKGETILFRPLIDKMTKKNRNSWNSFSIKIREDSEGEITHARVVRYLGLHIDDRIKYNEHVTLALEKARKAFSIIRISSCLPDLTPESK